ncbi:MAG: trypsin-like peptidase domain-containing protein [Candidatus Solibacter sp.]|nr:trypsin-like peptidase domain-containing protein [Candidatus Solibacter sp.]
MDQKVILRFRNASKAGTAAEFPVKLFRSVSIGRDPSCEVIYDSDRDDLVSRLHSKITIEAGNPPSFVISDFGSRNGTFVNHQRIGSDTKLSAGDVIQLGPGGPEFEFDLDPRPVVARPTRLADVAPVQPMPMATRQAGVVTPVFPPSEKVTLGKATVERMIVDSRRQTSRTWMMAGAGVLGVLALVGGLLSFSGVREKLGLVSKPSRLTPAEVAKAANEAVVFFEVGWKLVDMETGRPQPQQPPQAPEQPGGPSESQEAPPQPAAGGEQPQQFREIIPGGPSRLPVFISIDNTLEPLLVTDGGDGRNQAIGGRHSGSGFVVSSDGFILTNRHVAASWLALYEFDSPAGLVVQTDEKGNRKLTPIGARQFPRWVPAKGRFVARGSLDLNSPIVGQVYSGKALEGRNDYLDITFPRNRERVQGKLVRVSDQADVAMVKIDMPRALRKLELFDNYNTIAQGDDIEVLGYPGVSPTVMGAVQSREALTPSTEVRVIPDPTLSVGNIGRVIRGKAGLTEAIYSTFGDVYQLTVNSTGRGNSGGPVMDSNGRVVGLFTYSAHLDALITFAVPIRYGIELMGTKPVM